MQRLVYERIIRDVVEKTRMECVGMDDVLTELKARWEAKVVGCTADRTGRTVRIGTDEGAILTQFAKVSRKGDKWKVKMHCGVVQIDGTEFVFADGGALLDVDLCDG